MLPDKAGDVELGQREQGVHPDQVCHPGLPTFGDMVAIAVDGGLHDLRARWRKNWTKPISTSGMGITMPWRSPRAWGFEESGGMVRMGPVPPIRWSTTPWRRSSSLGRRWGGLPDLLVLGNSQNFFQMGNQYW